jgi:AcrR family transcriptional regulator
MLDTPSRILEVAEEMFADQGYRAVSLRSITRACNANIAAVHYHFGSKEAVLERIFETHCSVMNGERIRRLEACREEPGRPPLLEQILDAYLRPALALPGADERTRRFMRLRAAIAHEQAELSQRLVAKHFNAVSGRFVEALKAQLQHLTAEEVYWRFHFLLGAQYYTLANPGRIQALSDGLCNPSDTERAVEELIAFVAAGLRAPGRATVSPPGKRE